MTWATGLGESGGTAWVFGRQTIEQDSWYRVVRAD